VWIEEECNDHFKVKFLVRHVKRKEFIRSLQILFLERGSEEVCFKSLGGVTKWTFKEKWVEAF
jgi:hypothetical protein